MNPLYTGSTPVYAWQPLVHVCRRWRNLVFGSPRRLKLRLLCTSTTPVKDRLDVWPALPLVIVGNMTYSSDNVIAALGQSNRVREVDIFLPSRKSLGTDAGAIPRVDSSAALLRARS